MRRAAARIIDLLYEEPPRGEATPRETAWLTAFLFGFLLLGGPIFALVSRLTG